VKQHPATLFAALVLAAATVSCAAPSRLYMNPEADMSYYRKVAVLPFANLTGDRFANERVARAFVTELLILDRFQIVEPAEILDRLTRLRAEPDASGHVDPEKLKTALDALEAQRYIRGAVTEYQMRRAGSEDFPVVGMDVEMVDLATGKVVWRISITRKGRGRLAMVGAQGLKTFGAVTQDVCAEAVARLRSAAF